MQQFLTSCYDLRADEQAAGPETRYYNAFEQLLERVLQNTEVRPEGQSTAGDLIFVFIIKAPHHKENVLPSRGKITSTNSNN